MKYCFGVDIGGTGIKIGLFTMEGEILEKWMLKTRRENGGKAILPDVAESLNAKIEERGLRYVPGMTPTLPRLGRCGSARGGGRRI